MTDRWDCYLFTPHRRPWDSDLTHILVELHHPSAERDATAWAAQDFASKKKGYPGADGWTPTTLGDEALRSPDVDQTYVLFRVQNVTVVVSAALGDEDKAENPKLLAEQGRRAWRVATDLARSLTKLRQ
ncbi:hypothetical protein GCM10010411_75130 [Actinomadura fulvescens]|uniref:Uncharacterized protein n=1 Tax=Actinomadura fulvescens TaxID=46160 RepID=A0ABN3QI00_9ACTN